jgi:hypothetical protein
MQDNTTPFSGKIQYHGERTSILVTVKTCLAHNFRDG